MRLPALALLALCWECSGDGCPHGGLKDCISGLCRELGSLNQNIFDLCTEDCIEKCQVSRALGLDRRRLQESDESEGAQGQCLTTRVLEISEENEEIRVRMAAIEENMAVLGECKCQAAASSTGVVYDDWYDGDWSMVVNAGWDQVGPLSVSVVAEQDDGKNVLMLFSNGHINSDANNGSITMGFAVDGNQQYHNVESWNSAWPLHTYGDQSSSWHAGSFSQLYPVSKGTHTVSLQGRSGVGWHANGFGMSAAMISGDVSYYEKRGGTWSHNFPPGGSWRQIGDLQMDVQASKDNSIIILIGNGHLSVPSHSAGQSLYVGFLIDGEPANCGADYNQAHTYGDLASWGNNNMVQLKSISQGAHQIQYAAKGNGEAWNFNGYGIQALIVSGTVAQYESPADTWSITIDQKSWGDLGHGMELNFNTAADATVILTVNGHVHGSNDAGRWVTLGFWVDGRQHWEAGRTNDSFKNSYPWHVYGDSSSNWFPCSFSQVFRVGSGAHRAVLRGFVSNTWSLNGPGIQAVVIEDE